MKKAQFNMEFIMTVVIVFIIFAFILIFSLDKKNEVSELRDFVEARSQCNQLSKSIHLAYINGHGTKINFTLLNDADIISGRAVNTTPTIKVYFGDDSYSCITSYGQINDLDLNINKGEIEIKNINNTIFIR